MKITHFGGTEECNSVDELCEVLKKRYGNNANEFWISNEERTPCFGIMVRDECAYIQYFPDDESSGFVGLLENNSSSEDVMTFYTNTIDEEIEVFIEMVVPFLEVEKAVIDFFNNGELSKCLNWNEL